MANQTETDARGLLQVNVVNIQNSFPIRSARVTVFSQGESQTALEQLTTNSSGRDRTGFPSRAPR